MASRPRSQTRMKTKECDMCPPPSRRHAPSLSPQLPIRLSRRGGSGEAGDGGPRATGFRTGLLGVPKSRPCGRRHHRRHPRVRVPPRRRHGSRGGRAAPGFPPHPPPPGPHRVPAGAPRPPRPPGPGCGSRSPPEPLREARGGVCVMGRGLGNGGAAWEGPPEPRSPTRPGSQPRPGHPPFPPASPHGSRYLPVHCRTGQSFASKNRATQPASHTSGEKMAARARRKLPKVPERTGQRAAAERAERSGARRRETSGGAQGPGGVGASAVGCLRLPARLLPPSATYLLQWLAGRPGFPSVGGVSRTASSLHAPLCLRLARAAGWLPGSEVPSKPELGSFHPHRSMPAPVW